MNQPHMIEAFKAQIPMGEFGRPEDLGPLAVYLAIRCIALHDRRRPGHRRRLYALVKWRPVSRGTDRHARHPHRPQHAALR